VERQGSRRVLPSLRRDLPHVHRGSPLASCGATCRRSVTFCPALGACRYLNNRVEAPISCATRGMAYQALQFCMPCASTPLHSLPHPRTLPQSPSSHPPATIVPPAPMPFYRARHRRHRCLDIRNRDTERRGKNQNRNFAGTCVPSTENSTRQAR
jgi:hypothetical protein